MPKKEEKEKFQIQSEKLEKAYKVYIDLLSEISHF